MADAMDALKNILGDGAEDTIKNVMSSLSAPNDASDREINTDNLNQMMQLKSIVDSMTNNRNDPRSNLLMSLKPYMRTGRQRSIDTVVKILGFTSLTKFLKK